MFLIVDSGSTTASWRLLDRTGKLTSKFKTEGYNPHFVSQEYIEHSLSVNLPELVSGENIQRIFFYGSGCMAGKSSIVENALRTFYPKSKIEVYVDLLGSARALLKNKSGFAAILGTGTNTCLYDGSKITMNIDSLGFILGDEGSGGYMGKKFLREYLRDLIPNGVKSLFDSTFHLDADLIMNKIYKEPLPNRFCASFGKFIGDNIEIPYFYDLVKSSFVDFFKNLVSKYPDYQNYEFNCIGSVGYYFQDILKEVVNEYNMKPGKFILSPIDELVRYHLSYS